MQSGSIQMVVSSHGLQITQKALLSEQERILDIERPEVTPDITGETEEEQPSVEFENSKVTPPFGYIELAHDPELNKPHSAITESRATSSSAKREVFACMTSTPKENFAH